ncbi:MAG: hypothetical protein ABI183_14090 [Polyangiaceae bacterium]
MFIGHYAASFVAKKAAPKISLGQYFVAAQVLDILFSIFVLLGIEKMRLVPGFTETNNYDLYYMPFTHSLVGAAAWSLASTLAIFFAFRLRKEAIAFGVVVFSHFIFDIPVHTADLPIMGEDGTKIGLGLWRHWQMATGLELALLAIGLVIYAQFMKPIMIADPKRKTQIAAFSALLVLLTIATPFLPQPTSGAMFAGQALFGYLGLALLARHVDRPLSSTKVKS